MPGTQQALFDDRPLLRDQIAQALETAGDDYTAARLRRCHTVGIVRLCRVCQTRYPLPHHCNLRFCPWCSRRIAAERASIVRYLIPLLAQPKHVVLTQRNAWAIHPDYLAGLQRALRRLRQRRWDPPWHGGTWALEITNESRGWHPHYHLLVDTPWIDPARLARTWATLVRQQDIAIIAVRDARPDDYAQEVAKYVVKPNQLATWPPDDIRQYVLATRRVRAWGLWGNARRLWHRARQLAHQARSHEPPQCVCGASDWDYVPPDPSVDTQPDEAPYRIVGQR